MHALHSMHSTLGHATIMHPKYSILYGALIILILLFVVIKNFSGMAHAVCGFLLNVARQWMTGTLTFNLLSIA